MYRVSTRGKKRNRNQRRKRTRMRRRGRNKIYKKKLKFYLWFCCKDLGNCRNSKKINSETFKIQYLQNWDTGFATKPTFSGSIPSPLCGTNTLSQTTIMDPIKNFFLDVPNPSWTSPFFFKSFKHPILILKSTIIAKLC